MTRTDLTGRVIVVIGAARGIGAATSAALLRDGATVALADLDEPAVAVRHAALSRHGSRAGAFAVDVTRPESPGHLLEAVLRAHGQVDAMVNCAGVVVPGPVDAVPAAAVRAQVETNLLGTVHVSRAFLPHFRHRRRGHLIHLASLGGIVPLPGEAVYAATKFAVRGFCLSLALELRGTGIAVSVICPDSVDTAQLRTEARHPDSAFSFLSAPLEAAEVAEAILATVRRPRLEVMVPASRGTLARLGGHFPTLLARLAPHLERQGARRRERFLRGLDLRAAEEAP